MTVTGVLQVASAFSGPLDPGRYCAGVSRRSIT